MTRMFPFKGYRLRVNDGDNVFILPDRAIQIAKRNARDATTRTGIVRTIKEAWENNTVFAARVGVTSRLRGYVHVDVFGEILSVHDTDVIRA